MSRNIEDFINENRSQFDSDQPPARIWEKISTNLHPPQKKTARMLYRLVAAASIVAVIFIAGYFIVHSKGGQDISETSRAKDDILTRINPIYAKEVYHFTQLIELKQNELREIGREQPQLYEQFTNDIRLLDSSYTKLQKELPANPNREQLLEAMIQNLQLQTELLNQQLRVIKQIKQSKKSSDEDNSKSI